MESYIPMAKANDAVFSTMFARFRHQLEELQRGTDSLSEEGLAEALRALSLSLDKVGKVVDPEGVAAGSGWQGMIEREERMRLALEAAHITVWDWNLLSGEIICSGDLQGQMDLDPKSVGGCPYSFLALIHPQDRERVKQTMFSSAQAGKDWGVEFRTVCANDQIRWSKAEGRAFLDDSGTPIRMVFANRDITEDKLAEQKIIEAKHVAEERVRLLDEIQAHKDQLEVLAEEIAREKDKLQTIMENTDTHLAYLDSQFIFIEANSAYVKGSGRTREELVGKNHFDLFPNPQNKAIFENVKKTGRAMRFEAMPRMYDGQPWHATTYWDWALIPVKDASGRVQGLVSSLADVTERKLMEDELRESRAKLEERVQERTAELTQANEELQTAKVAAEAAARVKSSFLAAMSHEIRTPLNAVIGMASLLLDNDLNEEQKEYVQTIRSSGEDLMETVNKILDFSMMEKGKVNLECLPFDLKACLEDSLDLVAPKATEKNLKIAYSLDENVPRTIIGDVTRLRQVLVNLLGNAVKFTDRGKITVDVKARLQAGDHYELRFSVKDTGIGIPKERMEYLFLPFSQQDMSTPRTPGGAGLGLAISKKLVELMGGRIWAESKPGVGSTFFFTIMIEEADKRLAPAKKPERLPRAKPQQQYQLRRILLVEDNLANQAVILRMQNKLGYRADVVANGHEVMEALQRQQYDLILMDVQMPDMDGLEATRKIRQLWPLDGPYIIAITAHALEGDRERCFDSGMNDYIAKPVRLEELKFALDGFADASRSHDAEKKQENR